MFKKFTLKLSIFNFSILISLIGIIFMTTMRSYEFKAESIFEVSSEEVEIASQGLLGSFIGPSSNNANIVKSFLESREASSLFKESLDINKIFSNGNIAYFSRYGSLFWDQSFHSYYRDKVKIIIDTETNAVIVQTFAFTQEDSLRINLEIINMASDFLDRTTRLASFNAKTQRVCDLYYVNTDIFENNGITFDPDESIISESTSANELLLQKAIDFQNFCIQMLNKKQESSSNSLGIFPLYEIKSINAEASKKILLEIFEDSMNSVSASNQLRIIAEPILPELPESKKLFLYTLLIFLSSTIVLLSLRILIRLTDELQT